MKNESVKVTKWKNQEKGEKNSLKNVIIKIFVDSLIFDYTRDLIIFIGTLNPFNKNLPQTLLYGSLSGQNNFHRCSLVFFSGLSALRFSFLAFLATCTYMTHRICLVLLT